MQSVTLKNVYTTEEFLKEILNNRRAPNWIRRQCRINKIKTVAKHPYLIPQSEALRFISPK
jgi:hypothetical protein